MNDSLLCCDWGTSTFRLRWVDTQTRQVRGEVCSDEGIGTTYTAWQGSGTDRLLFYQQVLARHIARLAAQTGCALAGVPVVLSGMASASIGMVELPYAALPFPVSGSGGTAGSPERFRAGVRHVAPTDAFPHPIVLISGVRSEQDVMRGEETQLIGLYSIWKDNLATDGETVLILPGTHSKHVRVREGSMTDFRTYLTGELFALLSQQSVLKDSIQRPEAGSATGTDWLWFRRGVEEAASADLLKTLFSVRVNQLFGRADKLQNYAYLSGLLIGSELAGLVGQSLSLILCSGTNVYSFYQQAMQALDLTFTSVPAEVMEKTAVAGQLAVFRKKA